MFMLWSMIKFKGTCLYGGRWSGILVLVGLQMLVCSKFVVPEYSLVWMVFHLSSTCVQKGLLNLMHRVSVFCERKAVGVSKELGLESRSFAQSSADVCSLRSQEHCREDQKVWRSGIPRPPNFLGVKIILFEYWDLFPLMNLVRIFSISLVMSLLGVGRAVARWVNLDRRQVLVMLTLAVVVSLMVDHWKISCLTDLMAFCQLRSRCSRSPVSVTPRSLNGELSIVKPVVGVICRSSGALPNRAYFVFETFVARPDRAWKLLSMFRMCVSWCVGCL